MKCLFHTNIVGDIPTIFVGYVKKKILFLIKTLKKQDK